MSRDTSSFSSSLVRVGDLASGGMGRVELAVREQGAFRRFYAVKRLHAHLREDEDLRAMFLDEARLAGLIEHPNVVGVLDVGEDDEGPYLVMPFIDGVSISTLIRAVRERAEEIPLDVCFRIVADVAKGLHAAHELVDHGGNALNLVHRDVTPQNILIDWRGNVRITDFGVAKSAGQSSKTATGVLKGKIPYMAPEQLQHAKVDQRTDLFALGVVLYELLTCQRLYRNKNGEGVERILREAPPDVGEVRPEVPAMVTDLIFQMLAKKRDERPESAAHVQRVLEAALLEVEESVPLSDFVSEVARKDRIDPVERLAAFQVRMQGDTPESRSSFGWVAVVALLLGAIGLGWGLVGTEPPPEPAAEAPAETVAPPSAPSPPPVESSAQDDDEGEEPVVADEEVVSTMEAPPRRRRGRTTMRQTNSTNASERSEETNSMSAMRWMPWGR